MRELWQFNNWACADAPKSVKHDRDPETGYDESAGRPPSSTVTTIHRVKDDDPPARKATRAISHTTQDESSPVGTTAVVAAVAVRHSGYRTK